MIELRHFSALETHRQKALNDAWNQLLNRREIGFPRLTERHSDWDAIAARAAEVGRPKHVIVIGIGGSSLGTQVIYEAFRHQSACEVTFLESPDPHSWLALTKTPGWRQSHLVIISKSGNTLETLSLTEKLANVAPEMFNPQQVTVIASPGEGPLQQWAKARNYATLWIPTDVGGRFSVLTAVGMFPAALMGLKIAEFRAGAAWALGQMDLVSRLSSAIEDSWAKDCWTSQMWTYSESLKIFGEWWTQLWSESLGKKIDREGKPAPRASAPVSCRGPRDQHSLVQQLMEGPKDKFVFVLRVNEVEQADQKFATQLFPQMPFAGRPISLGEILASEAEAFEKSLDEVGIFYGSLRVSSLTEATLGALFMVWQMVIGQMGELMQINAFDQPGVEIGKKYAHKILSQAR